MKFDRKECFGLFVDVLGFKKMIGNEEYIKIYFELLDAINEILRHEHLNIMEMSDSIFFYCELDRLDADRRVQVILDITSQLQASFWTFGIQLRGAADIGELFIRYDNNGNAIRATGPLLRDCYLKENEIAKWGRIILSSSVINYTLKFDNNKHNNEWKSYLPNRFIKSDDKITMLNFPLWYNDEILKTEKSKERAEIAIKNINNFRNIYKISDLDNDSILVKSVKLDNFFNSINKKSR